MKCSFGISDFLEEIPNFPILLFSSISLHRSLKKAFLSLLAILWNSAFRCLYLSLPLSISGPCPKSYLIVLCLVTQACLTLGDAIDCSLPGSSVHGDSPGKNTGVGCIDASSRASSQTRDQTRSPALEVDSLPSEPPGSLSINQYSLPCFL